VKLFMCFVATVMMAALFAGCHAEGSVGKDATQMAVPR
jgi:hypothetical protein